MFWNENWFWTGLFTLLGALVGLCGSFVSEWLRGKHQLRLARLKMHETVIVAAYKDLYEFVSDAENNLVPDMDRREDFIVLMKSYMETVKPKLLFYPAEIREVLAKFEEQYGCLRNQDLISEVPFQEFLRNHAYPNLERLAKAIESRTDKMLHQP